MSPVSDVVLVKLTQEETLALRKEGIGVVLDSELPHLIGIDDDLLSTGIILYHLKVSSGRKNTDRVVTFFCHHPLPLKGQTEVCWCWCVFHNLFGLNRRDALLNAQGLKMLAYKSVTSRCVQNMFVSGGKDICGPRRRFH